MREAGGELDLPEESILAQGCGQLRVEHLDRDLTTVLRIVGQIDGRHPAATDLAQHAIAIAQRRRQLFQLSIVHAVRLMGVRPRDGFYSMPLVALPERDPRAIPAKHFVGPEVGLVGERAAALDAVPQIDIRHAQRAGALDD